MSTISGQKRHWSAVFQADPAPGGDLIASLQDVRYRYPGTKTDVLKGVSVDFRRGEIVAIMGANGSGKTTLVKHLNGLLKPGSGKVLLKGADTEKRTVAENARVVGFVYQNVNHQLFEESVLKELLFAPLNMGTPRADAVKVVHEVAASLDLTEEELALSPLLLSGGEKQRVAIASVLTPGPDIIALDEPTLGLNQGLKEKLAGVMRKLKAGGRTVVMVTHDVEFAMTNTDRVVLMADGEIIACGTTREILNSDVIERASLHPSQAVEIGKKLGVSGILTVDELVVRGT